MNKMNNKKIKHNMVSGLGILAIFTFGLTIVPTQVHGRGSNGTGTGALGGYITTAYESPNQIYYQTQYANPAPTPTVYSSTSNRPVAKAAPKKIAKAKTAPATNTVVTDEPEEDSSNLAANAVFGSNGFSFMPSGIIQWIFFAMLVLLIVILVRKVYGGTEKYLATPLKHD